MELHTPEVGARGPAGAEPPAALWPPPAATAPAGPGGLLDPGGGDGDPGGGGDALEADVHDCDCFSPPPEFRLPPPPRPPFLQEAAAAAAGSGGAAAADSPGQCSDAALLELEVCQAVPVVDAEYHSSPALPSLAVIAVCSLLLLAAVLIASVLVWKHKRKMQNFLPCKASPQNRCEVSAANGVIYEDLTNLRPRAVAPPSAPGIEMLDVKTGSAMFRPEGPVFICPPDPYASQDLYNPVYEELSNGSGDRGDSDVEAEPPLTRRSTLKGVGGGGGGGGGSEDEFAEDELSLAGDCCTSSIPDEGTRYVGARHLSLPGNHRRQHPPGRSLDRRRRKQAPSQPPPIQPPAPPQQFHEGLLMDALWHLYPVRPPNAPKRLPYVLTPPYECVPVLSRLQPPPPPPPPLASFRPPTQDSDSGYSNHTSGGRSSHHPIAH